MTYTEDQHAAMGEILTGWKYLRYSEIDLLCTAYRTLGEVLTVEGSANASLWHNLVKIGWAEMTYSPIDPADVPFEPLSFRLNDSGRDTLPHFLVFYDLLNMGECTPTSRLWRPEPAPTQPQTLSFRATDIVLACCFSAVGLLFAFLGWDMMFCAFLLTYGAVTALLLGTRKFTGVPERVVRGMAGANAAFLAISALNALRP